jgi:uncharacterized protein with ATP-grasp and redox domains
MITYLECIPCFIRQALEAVRMVTDDSAKQEAVLRRTLQLASEMDMGESPPKMGQRIHTIIKEITGNPDPYKAVKHQYNQFALRLYPGLKRKVEWSPDPFQTAVRLSIAGNLIDFAPNSTLSEERIEATIRECLNQPIDLSSVQALKDEAERANSILYLGDNAGEIVLDRLLVEQLPTGKVTFAVRGAPIINDATLEDAIASGITELVEVIDNGSDIPGTILESCSEPFRKLFKQADIIIAKGQGNYETLSNTNGHVFFLLKAKCPVIAKDIGCEVGDLVIVERVAPAGWRSHF